MKRKIFDWQSEYQSNVIPIPKFKSVDEYTNNFMGRLVRELLMQTDPKKTMYVDQMSGWFDEKGKYVLICKNNDKSEVIGISTFSLLNQSVGIFGLRGIDTILSFIIVKLLQTFGKTYKKEIIANTNMKKLVESLSALLNPPMSLKQNLPKQYQLMMAKLSKIWGFLIEVVIKAGRAQLLKRHIASELNFSCKLDANPLASSLIVMNKAVLNDVQAHKRKYENTKKCT